MQTEIMSNTHPKWDEFISQLSDLTIKLNCAHNHDIARDILNRYYWEVDIEKSIEYFKRKGGYCDCEILMNVYHPVPENIEDLLNELKY